LPGYFTWIIFVRGTTWQLWLLERLKLLYEAVYY
jgi:hypothetical protein